MGLSLFLAWIPSLLSGTFQADLVHAGVALFGAMLTLGVFESVTTRISACRGCEIVGKFRRKKGNWQYTECGTLIDLSSALGAR